MAFTGGVFGDNAATGATAAALSAVLADIPGREEFRQIDIKASVTNVGVIYIGPTTPVVSPTNAYAELTPGESWGLNPQSFTSPAGGDFKLQLDQISIIGTDIADQAFVAVLL
jgi:hypothetical protein